MQQCLVHIRGPKYSHKNALSLLVCSAQTRHDISIVSILKLPLIQRS